MKAVTECTNEEIAEISMACKELFDKVKGTTESDWFEDFKRTSGYAHYTFSGCISDKLVELLGHEPKSTEIILLVDGGFTHFGAVCYISNRHFIGKVNID